MLCILAFLFLEYFKFVMDILVAGFKSKLDVYFCFMYECVYILNDILYNIV